jgi:imidazolonepropionase-like amidohydrolase
VPGWTIVDSDPAIDPFVGEVLVTGDTIQCVAASCAGAPGAANATVVATNGIVMPGLIDAHNHILFDIFDETDWAPTHPYQNHNQWTSDARYSAMVDCKQYLNGEGNAIDDLGCEMDKYGELKAIIAGTTSVVGAANPANKKCYG